LHDKAKPVYVECVAAWITDRAEQQHVWELHQTIPPPLGFDRNRIMARLTIITLAFCVSHPGGSNQATWGVNRWCGVSLRRK
jgi:hypothetical protein